MLALPLRELCLFASRMRYPSLHCPSLKQNSYPPPEQLNNINTNTLVLTMLNTNWCCPENKVWKLKRFEMRLKTERSIKL